jgi:hypothetical protein
MFSDPSGLCKDPGGPGVRFCISAFIPTANLVSRSNPLLRFGLGDNRGADPYGGTFRIQQTIQIVGNKALQHFDIGKSVGPLGASMTGTSPMNSATLSGDTLEAIGSGHSEMAAFVANVGTILYDFQLPINPTTIGFFCGRTALVSGERTNYPSFEVWMYQDGASPTLLYHYDASRAGAAVEDLHSSTWLRGL